MGAYIIFKKLTIFIATSLLLFVAFSFDLVDAEAPILEYEKQSTDTVLVPTPMSLPKPQTPPRMPQNAPVLDDLRIYAQALVIAEFGLGEWEYFDELVRRESNWNPSAQNPNSSAFGLMQFLSGPWKSVGCVKTYDAHKQLRCGIEYVKIRYGVPSKAIRFHDLNNYY